MTRFAFASLIVTALSSFACSNAPDTAADVPAADTGGSDSDAVVQNPSDTATDAEPDADADVPLVERTLGQIELSTYPPADGSERWSASASFRRVREPVKGCETTVVGACFIARCSGATSTTTLATLDGGALTIARGRDGAPFPIVMSPDDEHRYAQMSGVGGAFVGGDALTFSAVGSSAFEPFSIAVTAPALLDVTAPSFDGTLGLDRSLPLRVSWSVHAGSDSSGTAELAIDYSPRATFVTCTWPVTNGQGDVPAEVLGVLPRGGLGEIRLTSVATASSSSGVHVRVSAPGSTPIGAARTAARFL